MELGWLEALLLGAVYLRLLDPLITADDEVEPNEQLEFAGAAANLRADVGCHRIGVLQRVKQRDDAQRQLLLRAVGEAGRGNALAVVGRDPAADRIELAVELGARQTYFTHMSHELEHDVTNAALPPGMELAHDGLRIPLT